MMTEEKRYRIPDAEYEDGWRTVTEEEYEDALEYLLKAKTLFKNFAEIDYRLACLYFKVKNYKKGTLHLTKALKIDFEYHSIIKEIFPEVYQMTIVQDVIDNFN